MTTFYNPVKLNAGLKALDSLQGELSSRGCYRPLFIVSPGAEKAGFINQIKKTCQYPELPVIVVRGGESKDDLRAAYRREGCDGVIAAGGEAVFKAARGVTDGPWAAVPCGEYGGRGLVPEGPDERSPALAVIDPRLFRAG
ncbi:MAG: iron-containing alcohol dehydrogenase, partial [Sediminispirochaetaceae bacterium]